MSLPTTDVRQLSWETRKLAENAVAIGVLELTNRGETYRVTLDGQQIVNMLLESVEKRR